MAITRKNRFPTEPVTRPKSRPAIDRQSGAAPKDKRAKAEAPTLPPPSNEKGKRAPAQSRKTEGTRTSGVQSRKSAKSDEHAATVDEVTADMSNDPRRERDEDD